MSIQGTGYGVKIKRRKGRQLLSSSSILTIFYWENGQGDPQNTTNSYLSEKLPETFLITCLALESQPLNCHLRTRYTVSWRTADQEVLCGHNRDHKPIILHTPDLSISDCHFVERQKREVHCLHENVNVADNQGKKEHSQTYRHTYTHTHTHTHTLMLLRGLMFH